MGPLPTDVQIPFTQQTLPNGLQVIVHEDHRCPIVAVDIWYHVGSKNEQPGRTGFAHLFEHLMFEGSAHYDKGFFRPLQQAGASLNGSTNTDRTNYWEVVPTSALELALWMESDRMGYLLPALTIEKFENQRDVVLNERRQNYENRPYGLAMMAVSAALYPPSHPYRWLTIGEPADLHAARFDDVRDFFRTYYHPGNASLVLAGDIDPDDTFRLARRYFEEVERGPDPPPIKAVPVDAAASGDTRIVQEDRVEFPRLYTAWHTPALFTPGDAAFDLLADVLGHGKTSRLYRTLVYERRAATDVLASQNSRELTGFFQVITTAAPGHDLGELDTAIMKALERVAGDGPTVAELERAQVQIEAHFVHRMQTVGGFGGKADQLNAYHVLAGDAGYVARDLERYREVAAADLREAAAQLLHAPRISLSVVPEGESALALANSSPGAVS